MKIKENLNLDNFSFVTALDFLRDGRCVRRKSWLNPTEHLKVNNKQVVSITNISLPADLSLYLFDEDGWELYEPDLHELEKEDDIQEKITEVTFAVEQPYEESDEIHAFVFFGDTRITIAKNKRDFDEFCRQIEVVMSEIYDYHYDLLEG